MPKLSSALTAPEKSSACLPVSTIAEAGVITRMPSRVHEHGRFGVPVRLAADVDAGDDDVDLAAGLRELDQPAQGERDPVHVLGARVHGDQRAAADTANHSTGSRCSSRVGKRGVDTAALRFGQVAEALRRIGQQHDAPDSFGHHVGGVVEESDDEVRRVRARLALHRYQLVVAVEVEFLERAGGQPAARAAAG